MPSPVQLTPLSISPPKQMAPIKIRHQDKAAYGVAGQGFFDDKSKFWPMGSALYFEGVPNKDLIPLNKLAHERLQAFYNAIDELGERKAKKEGKLYVRTEFKEWVEGDDHEEIPMPEYIMAVPAKDNNEQIR